MTVSEPHQTGLDQRHILAICTRATGTSQLPQAVSTYERVRVSLPSRPAAWDARAALSQAGYTAVLAGHSGNSRYVVVTGWNTAQLDWRLTALRAIMHRLADNPLITATAAVRQFAALPSADAGPAAAAGILGQARKKLQGWVETRAGVCVPSAPTVLPADAGTAVRVRAVTQCEELVSGLVDRHLRVAQYTLSLFASLRPHMNNAQAQRTALRRASAAFHLSGGSFTQDSSAPMPRTPMQVPPAQLPGRDRGRPGWDASREFPAGPGVATPASAAPAAGQASLGGRHFPAARPGRR